MLVAIAEMTTATSDYTGISEINGEVMSALYEVDRARYVPDSMQPYAYVNRPLGIGYEQTISQPFIVALMTHVLDISAEDVVLEIGTGSGYQAAILAELASEVFTIEIVEELAYSASLRLKELGYENVHVRAGDGWHGSPSEAPFDKIIITAVAPQIPPLLFQQLKEGGLMVLPIERAGGYQELILVEKLADDKSTSRSLLPVRFVPMTGEAESTKSQ